MESSPQFIEDLALAHECNRSMTAGFGLRLVLGKKTSRKLRASGEGRNAAAGLALLGR
jgi:hypothetical protein